MSLLKRAIVRWLGHLWRSEHDSAIRTIMKWQVGGSIKRDRQSSIWMNNVEGSRLARVGKW